MLKITNSRQPVRRVFTIPHHGEMLVARATFFGRVEEAIATGSNLDTFRWFRSRRHQGAGAEGIDLAPSIAMSQRKKTKSERTGAQTRRSAHAATQAKRPHHA
jgi:hypothetical protein